MSHHSHSEDEVNSDTESSVGHHDTDEDTSEISENETSNEEEEVDAWNRIQDEAIERHRHEFETLVENYKQNGDNDEVAEARANNDLLSTYRKELREVLFEELKWMHQLKGDPTYKKLMATKRSLMDEEDYDWYEATELAIHKRKFLLNKLFAKVEIPKQKSTKNDRFHPYIKKYY